MEAGYAQVAISVYLLLSNNRLKKMISNRVGISTRNKSRSSGCKPSVVGVRDCPTITAAHQKQFITRFDTLQRGTSPVSPTWTLSCMARRSRNRRRTRRLGYSKSLKWRSTLVGSSTSSSPKAKCQITR